MQVSKFKLLPCSISGSKLFSQASHLYKYKKLSQRTCFIYLDMLDFFSWVCSPRWSAITSLHELTSLVGVLFWTSQHNFIHLSKPLIFDQVTFTIFDKYFKQTEGKHKKPWQKFDHCLYFQEPRFSGWIVSLWAQYIPNEITFHLLKAV